MNNKVPAFQPESAEAVHEPRKELLRNNKMQAFHEKLFQPAEVFNPHTKALVQLTQVSPSQMDAMANTLDWGVWGTDPA